MTTTEPEEKKAMSILDLDALIKRYIKDVEKTKADLKEQKSMFDDSFKSNAKYKESDEKVKAINREKQAVKQLVMKEPAVVAVNGKMNELKDEIKDLQDSLSGYVTEYQRLTGAKEFEDEDGNIREIIHVVKLVKRFQKK